LLKDLLYPKEYPTGDRAIFADWLSTSELALDNIQVYPNLTKDIIHINSEIKEEI
tara:strand:- start:8640 stop:8804 length:165 start_codon:yes stop_codon:yes gene_type:complete